MVELLIGLVILSADMVLKYLSPTAFNPPVSLIRGVLELNYVENTGAAWGLFSGSGARYFFLVISLAFMVVLALFYMKMRAEFRVISRFSLCLIFFGTLGNFYDRLVFGYVRDMIYFRLINFPVFNIADSAIVLGAILLCIEVLFLKRNTFDMLECWIKSWKKPS